MEKEEDRTMKERYNNAIEGAKQIFIRTDAEGTERQHVKAAIDHLSMAKIDNGLNELLKRKR